MSETAAVSGVGEEVATSTAHNSHDPNTVIGVSICTNCRARFRVKRQHHGLIGKSIRCPRCQGQFVVVLDTPTLVEEAAIKAAEESTSASSSVQVKRKKRTKIQILKQNLKSIKKSLLPFHLRLNQINSDERSSEEQIRVWCLDVLRDVLGYRNEDIDTEMSALH